MKRASIIPDQSIYLADADVAFRGLAPLASPAVMVKGRSILVASDSNFVEIPVGAAKPEITIADAHVVIQAARDSHRLIEESDRARDVIAERVSPAEAD